MLWTEPDLFPSDGGRVRARAPDEHLRVLDPHASRVHRRLRRQVQALTLNANSNPNPNLTLTITITLTPQTPDSQLSKP